LLEKGPEWRSTGGGALNLNPSTSAKEGGGRKTSGKVEIYYEKKLSPLLE